MRPLEDQCKRWLLTKLDFAEPSGLRIRFGGGIFPCFSILGVKCKDVKGWDEVSTGARMILSTIVKSSKAGPFQSVQPGSSTGCSGASQRVAASSHKITLINSCQQIQIPAICLCQLLHMDIGTIPLTNGR